jgi:hypothetical protein
MEQTDAEGAAGRRMVPQSGLRIPLGFSCGVYDPDESQASQYRPELTAASTSSSRLESPAGEKSETCIFDGVLLQGECASNRAGLEPMEAGCCRADDRSSPFRNLPNDIVYLIIRIIIF